MIVIQKYGTVIEANFKIRGGLVGGVKTSAPFDGLIGQTITFSNPAGACTFVAGTGVSGQLRFAEVKLQLEAAIANLLVETTDNALISFLHKTDGQFVSLAALPENARRVLGLPYNEAIAGLYLNPPDGLKPRYLEFVSEYGAVYVSAEV